MLDKLSTLPALFNQLTISSQVPGAQFTLYHNGQLIELATGVEHIHLGTPVTTRSRFALGSVSKVATATVVMQMLEDDDISLDDPVAHYLPRAINSRTHTDSITLRQLLSHTSGLIVDHDEVDMSDSSLRKSAASMLSKDLVSRPGSVFSYSNSGYALIGYVIEAVSGQSWWDTIQSYLFDPHDLDFTFINDPRSNPLAKSIVAGHAVDASSSSTVPVDFYCERGMAPAGGLAASATTLVDLARSFMVSPEHRSNNPVADLEVLRHMWSPVPAVSPFGLADSWGAGWGLHERRGRLWAGHDGTLDGGTCHVRLDPDGGTALALTTNSTSGLTMWPQLVDVLDSLELYVGNYRTPDLSISRGSTSTGLDISGHYTNGDLTVTIEPTPDGNYQLKMPNGVQGAILLSDSLQFNVRINQFGGDLDFVGRFSTGLSNGSTIDAIEYNGRYLRREMKVSPASPPLLTA